MIAPFTKRKFLKLNLLQQHKRLALSLREIYEAILNQQDPKEFVDKHNEYLQWMQLDPYFETDLKKLSNQYHEYLKKAEINLKEHNLLPSIRTGDGKAKREFGPCAVYLDNIRSAYNVGSILRTVEAFRYGSVHFAKKTPFTDHPKVQKISMGTSDVIPCYQGTKLDSLPKPIIVVDTSDSAIPLYDFVFPDTFTLVMGNEEYGVSDEALEYADYIVEIPLSGIKNSINVACAFSIVNSHHQSQLLKKELIHA